MLLSSAGSCKNPVFAVENNEPCLRRKREEGRRKKEEGRRKKEEVANL
ncbi:MAG: hypothetical protein HC849_21075 [Oscillatoriales cyanobacterium RU_3_3]|nr:hypothetical protein [Oscillatoriales cyanobacterium RU_3_3]